MTNALWANALLMSETRATGIARANEFAMAIGFARVILVITHWNQIDYKKMTLLIMANSPQFKRNVNNEQVYF